MFGLGWPEIAIVLLVAVFIFGPKKLPELGNALGRSLRGFKDELKTSDREKAEVSEKSEE